MRQYLQKLADTLGVLCLMGLVFASTHSAAQLLAAPAAPTFKVQWDQPETLAITQGYQFTLRLDANPETPLTPTCVVLTGVPGANTRCTAPLAAATMTPGAHTVTVTTYNGFGSASSDPLAGSPPNKPVSVTVIVIVS